MKKTVEAEPTVSAHTNAAALQRKIAAEEKLASHYEKYQQYEQYVDGWRKMLAKFSRTERYQLREYFKENPGKQPVAEKLLREEFSDDDEY